MVRGGGDKASALLEVWGGGRLLRELSVPTTLHGAVYNDGWFAAGAAWSPDEQRVAYVAEVRNWPCFITCSPTYCGVCCTVFMSGSSALVLVYVI